MASESISKDKGWSLIIKPQTGLFSIDIKELWAYRDLLFLFVRRDFVTLYKQTILGPLWFFIQPLLTTLMFVVIFARVAGISTQGVPPVLFYLSGVITWNYFAECVNSTSGTFTKNANIFGKVYFPRLIVPISIIISNLLKFGVQFLLFVLFFIYYLSKGYSFRITEAILLLPLLLLIMALLGLGFGIIISSLTTKYRDLTFLVSFGIQLLMYASPVIYSLSSLPEKYRLFILANPMSSVIETFRFAVIGVGSARSSYLLYSSIFSLAIVFVGIFIFTKVEKTFMDTV